ncbi:MAG: M1 family peptidase, partial [Flavobacteriales bacterium]|nr:M1 family peptidase [Flavobacteriales bacterium]
MRHFTLSILILFPFVLSAQQSARDKFEQLGKELPTPNVYRTASGAPGHEYYQQQVDYDMKVELDDETQRLYGSSTITYTNNSPDELNYLWLQLDQNVRAKDSDTKLIATSEMDDRMSFGDLARMHNDFDGGFKIEYVKDAAGNDLPYTVVKTMMRVDLPKPLKAKGKTSIKLKWWYNINDRMEIGGRSGYEFFPEDGNYLYTIAQWFPRLCVYNEVEGWQHKQFLGSGEFALPFGDYKVDITVPADHIVGATGFCQNYSQVLTAAQKQKFDEAKDADEPVIIVSQKDAEENEKEGTKEKKTWTFKAT